MERRSKTLKALHVIDPINQERAMCGISIVQPLFGGENVEYSTYDDLCADRLPAKKNWYKCCLKVIIEDILDSGSPNYGNRKHDRYWRWFFLPSQKDIDRFESYMRAYQEQVDDIARGYEWDAGIMPEEAVLPYHLACHNMQIEPYNQVNSVVNKAKHVRRRLFGSAGH